MEMALGMSEVEANDTGLRGVDQGTQMKMNFGWSTGNGGNGTNSSGFSGLPGGYRDYIGYFFNAGSSGAWWSSSPDGSSSWSRDLNTYYDEVDRSKDDQRLGFSVRCIQDAE